MILEEETYKKFGYYPSDLKPKSNKRIVAKCDDCGKIRESRKADYYSLCFFCARKLQKGKKCPNYGKNKLKTAICLICGIKFTFYPSQMTGKYCSKSCEFKSRIDRKRENKKKTAICLVCGMRIDYYPSMVNGKYCSRQCAGIAKRNKIKCVCQYCKKEFRVKPCEIKKGGGKYCSRSCARKGRKGFPTHHTKPELIFEQICKKNNLPFKYTGDGVVWIHNINPDFVECNGKKIAIEIFSYWHNPLKRHCKVPYSQTYEGRMKILKRHKWKLIVFWESDLLREDAEQFVLQSVRKQGTL